MKPTGPDPSLLIDLSMAAWRSQVLFAGLDLRVFDHLADAGDAGLDSDALAERCGTAPRAFELLLNAAAGLGLLAKRNGKFFNNELSTAYLVSKSPAYWGGILGYAKDVYGLWGQLTDSLQRSGPAKGGEPETYLGGDEATTRRYVEAFWNNAMNMGRAVTAAMDLSGVSHLLDMGGGPGAYASLLCQRFPELRVTVLEMPAVAAIGQEKVAELGLGERITFLPGDYKSTPIENLGHDAFLTSGTMHRETDADARAIVSRAVASLPSGGLAILNDVMLKGDGTQPVFATLFALNMTLTAPGGGAHSTDAHEDWLRAAGCSETSVIGMPPPIPYTLVTGKKA